MSSLEGCPSSFLEAERRQKKRMFNRENELILFNEWIKDKHKEDMSLFEERAFSDPALFKAIRDESLTMAQLGASKGKYNTTLSELAQAIGSGAFYRGALGDAIETQRDIYIDRLRNDKDNEARWIEKITGLTNLLNAKEEHKSLEGFSSSFFTELDNRRNEINPHYGFKELDEVTHGLHRGQLVTVCARPGCGKSVFGLQVANHAREEGYKVLYIPLEMTPYQTFKRLIVQSGYFDIDNLNDIERGLTVNTETQIRSYLDELEEEDLLKIYYGLYRLADIEKVTKEEEPFLIVVDQLTQVEPPSRAKDIRDKYMQVTDKLKKLALSQNVCVLALHQLNRKADEIEHLTLSNLAESDSVGRDSDVVLVFKTREENPQLKGVLPQKLTVLKNREGGAGEDIYLALNGGQAKFSPCTKEVYEGAGDADEKPKRNRL